MLNQFCDGQILFLSVINLIYKSEYTNVDKAPINKGLFKRVIRFRSALPDKHPTLRGVFWRYTIYSVINPSGEAIEDHHMCFGLGG